MKFDELKSTIKGRYRNGRDQIGRDLVAPCIEHATLYRRGTGFFSSSAMLAYVGALDNLIHDRIKIQILCSPVVHDRVVLETIRFNKDPESRLKTLQRFSDDIVLIAAGFRSEATNAGRKYRQQLLSYLIARKTIEIKFALPRNFTDADFQELVKISEEAKDLEESEEEELEQGELTKNLYHVKNGYFLFQTGEMVVFDGSFNESLSGHKGHIDSTNVWRSWIPEDKSRLDSLKAEIDEDFDETSLFFKVVPLGEEALRIITEGAPKARPRKQEQRPPQTPDENASDSEGLRNYQREAFEAWKNNNFQGIIALATGTGKTRTAISIIHGYRESAKHGLVIVSVPYQPLAFQWADELKKAGISSINVFENVNAWSSSVANIFDSHIDQRNETKRTPILLCVNATFRAEEFQSQLRRLDGSASNRLLVIDECHHFNNKDAIRTLPNAFNLRLGLSATPYEEGEEKHLSDYFGQVVFEYTISQAIQGGYLCPYEYHPIFIEFSTKEMDEVLDITRRILEKPSATANFDELDRALESAAQKLLALEKVLTALSKEERAFSLFYCGRGSIQLPSGEEIRQVATVTSLLNRLKVSVGKITYQETRPERVAILNSFKAGNLEALASIRVLDEGIDIPDCKSAFILASQRSERQGIQRRGRILRKSNNKAIARLYDFIIIGPRCDEVFLKNLYEKELRRARLFSEDANNRAECMRMLGQLGA